MDVHCVGSGGSGSSSFLLEENDKVLDYLRGSPDSLRRLRRRLPSIGQKQQSGSSKSFDSGISGLLLSSPSPTRSAIMSIAEEQRLYSSSSKNSNTFRTPPSSYNPPGSPSFKKSSSNHHHILFSPRRSVVETSAAAVELSAFLPPSGIPNISSPLSSSPILRGSSSESPAESSPMSPASPPASFRASRRLLPETPSRSLAAGSNYSNTTSCSSNSSGGPSSSSTNKSSSSTTLLSSDRTTHLLAWQSVTSHESSIDSGVYSRSDSIHFRNISSPVVPESPFRSTWRRSFGAPVRSWGLEDEDKLFRRRSSLPAAEEDEASIEGGGSSSLTSYAPQKESRSVHFESPSSINSPPSLLLLSSPASSSTDPELTCDKSYDIISSNSSTASSSCSSSSSSRQQHIILSSSNNSSSKGSPSFENTPKLRDVKSHSFPPSWCPSKPLATAPEEQEEEEDNRTSLRCKDFDSYLSLADRTPGATNKRWFLEEEQPSRRLYYNKGKQVSTPATSYTGG